MIDMIGTQCLPKDMIGRKKGMETPAIKARPPYRTLLKTLIRKLRTRFSNSPFFDSHFQPNPNPREEQGEEEKGRHYSEMMMVGKEDLRLRLSLSSSEDHDQRFPLLQLTLISSSERSSSETRPFFKGIDVNQAAGAERETEEEAGVSSPNSTISSLSGKRSERDVPLGEETEFYRACSRGISDDEDDERSRKKLRLSKDQSVVLEESFKEHNTLNPKQKLALAKQLGLRPRQVEVWFQNRRARTKLKQTEVDCEFLKKCCENLTEENRRLQKEVQELRALKMSPQFYMHMTPPTTLTMCPSCERVVVASSTAASPPSQSAENHIQSNCTGVSYHRQHLHHHRPVHALAVARPSLLNR